MMGHKFLRAATLVFAVFCTMGEAVAEEPTISVEARQRYPWNGLVDIKFTVTGESNVKYDTSFVIKDLVGGTNLTMRNVRKSDGTAVNVANEHLLPGIYNWIWYASADLPKDFECEKVTVSGVVEKGRDKVQLWEGGPYWATTNIGAEKPEDSGYYFWWGDTVGYKWENDKWVASDGLNLDFSFKADNVPTYGQSESSIRGWVDSKGCLLSKNDAAHVHWCGDWRMPTYSELCILLSGCEWTSVITNGVDGYIVRGKGEYASNSIFLPCPGYAYGMSRKFGASGYWSSSRAADNVNWGGSYLLRFFNASSDDLDYWKVEYTSRHYGYLVRPVFVEEYVVILDAQGGNGGGVFSRTDGTAVGQLPNPTKEGYKFVGWWTASKGGTRVDGATIVTGNATYYAHWEKIDKVQLWEGGPYWATTNIGAEKPEDSGYYFWWGDTVGYKRENDKWVASDGSNSNFSFSESNTPTCNKTDSALLSEGWIASDGVLVPEHDAANVYWGNGWRLPTDDELSALNNNCDWTWTTQNGVNGYVIRGRGAYASNSIFLPTVGYGEGTSLWNSDLYGYYWTSVPDSYDNYRARHLYFYSSRHSTDYVSRYLGQAVRPIKVVSGE
ncbi:MAG: InlB B-repeat-containing protein [Bacteroides sp.]|nr:InlB B-repeat-containing protein [Bacteroides sp.]